VAAAVKKLDAVLLTHSHADHLHGLDDIRPLCRGGPLPVYGNRSTIDELRERFSYAFKETQRGGGKPRLAPTVIDGPIRVGGLAITPVPVQHGRLDILGWQITEPRPEAAAALAPGAPQREGRDPTTSAETTCPPRRGGLLYLTDTSAIPETSRALITRPDVLIIDGLRVNPHETHFSFAQALETGLALGARQTWLTHICHNHLHTEIEKYCEDFKKENDKKNDRETATMSPAWDGLELTI
jgi:phosphoribosyl 1,2-cyclic phosphate phosphodiesterase